MLQPVRVATGARRDPESQARVEQGGLGVHTQPIRRLGDDHVRAQVGIRVVPEHIGDSQLEVYATQRCAAEGDLRGGGVDLVTDEAIWRCPHVEGLQQRDADAARGVIQGSTIDISRQGCEQSAGA